MPPGKAVFIAETKDSRGEILPVGNQALYPDAFDGIEADLLYVSEIHGAEQLVIFRSENSPIRGSGASSRPAQWCR